MSNEILSINVGFGSESGIGDHSVVVSGRSVQEIADQIENDDEFGAEGHSQRLYPETDAEFLLAGEIAKILNQQVSVDNRNMPENSALSKDVVEAILWARA